MNNMNIDLSSKVTTKVNSTEVSKASKADAEGAKFSDELTNLCAKNSNENTIKNEDKQENVAVEAKEDDATIIEVKPIEKSTNEIKEDKFKPEPNLHELIGGLTDVVTEMNNKLGHTDVVAEMNNKLGHTDENSEVLLKQKPVFDDNKLKNEDNSLINNDMNVQELKEALAFQMNASMNFDSNGQAFSDFMENQKKGDSITSTSADLAEEKNILSSMDENIAIANRNKALAEAKIKTVTNSEGIKRVDKNTNITVENVVKFDEVIMNKSDVEFFTQLVENGQTELTAENVKSAQVSKTLADLIAKSMKDNQPVRIDFDNNISVIIKISKDGKISADFLPSSQIAEAYLKENLPLLKQRFDENNIEYDSLNRRERKQDEKENQKKGRKDE